MPLTITRADLAIMGVSSNPKQFEAVGNPWVAPGDWYRELALAQDPLTASAMRRSALDFVRPGTPPEPEPLPRQRLDHPDDGSHATANRRRRAHRDWIAFAQGRTPPSEAPPAQVTQEDVQTFRRAVAKIDNPSQHHDIGWDVDVAREKARHAEWLARERAEMAARRRHHNK